MGALKRGKFIITLKSDLCVGSGYSYAGVVDSDTCYDEVGIPYIPARRLKGCMRETADTLLYGIYPEERINEVFGKSGRDSGTFFRVDNAYIEDYENVREFLAGQDVCNTQEILERFTHVIGQTRLENGVADKGSLRYTRVVNRYSPMHDRELSFVAEFTCKADDWMLIEKCALATRHIGLKRNRGLGNVVIKVEEVSDNAQNASLIKTISEGNGKTVLAFAVKNLQPLMISRTLENESVDYIPGQQVLGLLAGRYISSGNSPEDKAFKDLFLNGKTVFDNLYPFAGGRVFYPAPDSFNRLKKTKKIVYNIGAQLPDKNILKGDYDYTDGNQPKKLKGKFLSVDADGTVCVLEVKKDVVYHHSHRNTHPMVKAGEIKEEGILYGMEVIRRGQTFAGTIIVPTEYADIVRSLLLQDDLRFGKSKTAQYGKCCLTYFDSDSFAPRSTAHFMGNEDIVVTFLSDAIIYNRRGEPTVSYDEVREAVARELGAENSLQCYSSEFISSLQVTTATGYMGTWNLRRPAIPAIKAGSFLTFKLNDCIHAGQDHIGERTLEGYGHISIDAAGRWAFDGVSESASKVDTGRKTNGGSLEKEMAKLLVPIVYDRWLKRKIYAAISESKINITNAAVGRMTLMLRESVAEAGAGNECVAFKNFADRIKSIKSISTRGEGERLLRLIGKSEKVDKDKVVWSIDANNAQFFTDKGSLISDLKALWNRDSDNDLIDENELIKRWPQYILAIFTDRKYKGR